jgi:hypothetical protein
MGSTTNINAIIVPKKSYLKFASVWKVSMPPYIFMHFVLQIALDVGSFCYMRVAQVCLPSRRLQIQDFSGMIVSLILVVDPACSSGRFFLKNVL